MRYASAALIFFLLPFSAPGLSMPAGWDFGTAGDRAALVHTFAAVNDGSSTVTVRLVSPCDCLTLVPSTVTRAPGKSITVTVRFDPAGYSGRVEKPVLVDVGSGRSSLFTVSGTIRPERAASTPVQGTCEGCEEVAQAIRQQAYESWRKQPSVVHYYYSPDCASCTEFLAAEVPLVEKRIGRKIELDQQDIRSPGVLDELDRVLAAHDLTLTVLPVLVAGDTVLQGDKEIRARFEAEMRKRAEAAAP